MPDKRTHAGILNVTTGRTHPPPLTEGHEMPHVEDLIADGYMTEQARTVAICAAILWAHSTQDSKAIAAVGDAANLVTLALEWDRHERFQKR